MAILAAAVVLAAIGNVVLYLIVTGPLGQPLLMPAESPPPELVPLGMIDVVLFSAVLGVGAVVVYSVIRAFSARPLRVFAVVGLAALVVSFLLPAAIPSPPVEWAAKLVLMAMHVLGYMTILATLWVGTMQGWLTPASGAAHEGRASS